MKQYENIPNLYCMLCVPGKHAPKSMKIIAKVSDGRNTVQYQFGHHVPISTIIKQIQVLYKDNYRSNKIEVKKGDEELNAIMLRDGCIIVLGD